MAAIDETAARLHTHEEVCAERYGKIEFYMWNEDTTSWVPLTQPG